jgi:glycosyltransferase involved in cell wall biosynthesis
MASGYVVRSDYILREQQRHGWEPRVATPPDFTEEMLPDLGLSTVPRGEWEGIPFIHFEGDRFRLLRWVKRWPPFRGRGRLLQALRRRCGKEHVRQLADAWCDVDVLHAHSPAEMVQMALKLRSQRAVPVPQPLTPNSPPPIPVVYEVRGLWEETALVEGWLQPTDPKYQEQQRQETWAAHSADRLVTISEGLKRDFVARGIPEEKIDIVPNGVDVAQFTPRPPDEELRAVHRLQNKVVVGYVSSLRRIEGLDYLVEAMRDVVKESPEVVCLIVGDGPERPQVEAAAARDGLSEHVLCAGRVPHTEVTRYYSLIDVFVVPRRRARVTELVTPLKPLEAMAMGKALLVSDVGGLTELVTDGKTGLTFSAEQPDNLARQLLRLVREAELRRRLGTAAREEVVATRQWPNLVARYHATYERARATVKAAEAGDG